MSNKPVPPLFDAIHNEDSVSIEDSFFDLMPDMSRDMIVLAMAMIKEPNQSIAYYATKTQSSVRYTEMVYEELKQLKAKVQS